MSFKDQQTPLHTAAQNGYDLILQTLISHGADVNFIEVVSCTACKIFQVFGNNALQYDRTPLHFAAKNGSKSMVECLITKGAQVDAPAIVSSFVYTLYIHACIHT